MYTPITTTPHSHPHYWHLALVWFIRHSQYWAVIISQSLWFTFEFTLHVTPCLGISHLYNVTYSPFQYHRKGHPLTLPSASPVCSPAPLTSGSPSPSTISVPLPIPESRTVGIVQCGPFSHWLLWRSNMYFRFLHAFCGLIAIFL